MDVAKVVVFHRLRKSMQRCIEIPELVTVELSSAGEAKSVEHANGLHVRFVKLAIEFLA